MLDLTDDELSALIEACNHADWHGRCRPPWDRFGRQAWRKLIDEEKHRAGLVCEHGIRDGEWCRDCNKAYKEAAREAGYEETQGMEGVRPVGTKPGPSTQAGRGQGRGQAEETKEG